jgi:hypothetical protein
MDNFLEIGATVILDGLTAGMESAQEIVGESTSAMGGMFASLGESSAAATTKIVEGAAVAGEAVQGMSERFVEAAETAKLSAEGMGSAFSGLGALLGAGIVGGFFLHAIDETQKLTLELAHLSEQTGISTQTLAGLHAVAEETGVSFQSFETALVRLLRAQELAVEGGKSQILAFERLKISVEDIKKLSPEDLFYRTAAAINESSSAADTAASAIALFGRGGAALIPVLKAYGDELRIIVDEHGKVSLGTKEASEAAEKYQKITAEMSEMWRGLTVPAMEVMVDSLQKLDATFQNSVAAVKAFGIESAGTFRNTVILAEAVGSALKSGVTGGAQAMEQAWSAGMAKLEANNAQAAKAVHDLWEKTDESIQKMFTAPFQIPVPKDIPTGEPKAKKDTSASDQVKQDEKDFNERFRAMQKFADEEDKLNLQEVEQYQKIQDIESDAFAKHEIAKLDLAKKTIDEELKDKKISADEAVKLLTDLEDKEYKIRKDAIVARIKLEEETTDNPVVLAKLNAQLQALADQHQAKLTDIYTKGVEARKKAADAEEKHEQQIQDRMAKNFEKLGQYELFQAKSFADGLNHIWKTIEEAFAQSLLRMMADWMSHLIMRLALHGAEQEGEVAQHEAASLQKRGIDFLDTMKTVTNAAVKAAVGAYDAIVGIPIIGPILAPIAAGVAFAGVEAFGALASAEGGWDVPRDSLAYIHKQEMILPAPLAQRVREMTGAGNTESSNYERDVHIHFTSTIQALDAQGFERVIQTHNQALGRQIVRIFRNGNLKLDHALR